MRPPSSFSSIHILLILIFSSLTSSQRYSTSPSPSSLPSSYLTIDNGIIGEPEVRCGSEDISLHFQTMKGFMGKIFVKGHVGESECVRVGDQKKEQTFVIRHDSCGVRRQREINGVVIIATVIVSFHSIFITKVDRAYRTSCFYMESTRVVNTQVDVGQLTTAVLRSQVPIPTCKYEILGGGRSGSAVTFARIGDSVYHKWSCDAAVLEVYCMRVHTCTVYDGQGGNQVTVVDHNGCSVDSTILPQLDYTADLEAGQESPVFKFADRVGLYFNCQIQLTLKEKPHGCSNAQPACPSPFAHQAQVEPSTKTSEDVDDMPSQSERGKEEEHKSGYPTRDMPYTGRPTTRPYSSKEIDMSATATTPSGYKYTSSSSSSESTAPSDEHPDERDHENSEGTRPPYTIKVNPFDSSMHSKDGAMPPGVKPSSSDRLNPSTSTEVSSEEYKDSRDISAEQTRVSPSTHSPPEPYTRLIRRRARARSAGRTVEEEPVERKRNNTSNPLFVADFDLPEKGLIVLGLEDGDGAQSLSQSDRLFQSPSSPEETSCIERRVLPLAYASLFGSLVILLALATSVLSYIVFRQRQLLKSPLL